MKLSGTVTLISRRLFLTVMVLHFFSCMLLAQDATGRMIGTVRDQAGALVTGARIVVTNTATGVVRETTTNASGYYQVLSLPVGSYSVSASHVGFRTASITVTGLEINQSVRVDIELRIGVATETVKVEVNAATVETINPTMASTVLEREIANAPLNGRNVLDLALLQPGVLPADNPGNGSANSATTAFSISGGRSDSNTFILDGGVNNDLLNNRVVYNPNPDSIQEFKVLTSNFTAEYGRNSGGIVTVVTKSGSNSFHGSGFEFNRNTAYNANDFISNSESQARNMLRRNQYGGTFGGPILKNKLFFFVSYQGKRQTQSATSDVGTTFTSAQIKGDFSNSASRSDVASFLAANPFFQPNAVLAAQGIIDPSRIDPVAQAYINAGLIPVSSLPLGNISFQTPERDNSDEIGGKFDWQLSDKDHVTTTLGRSNNLRAIGAGLALQPAVPAFGINADNHRQFFSLAYTRVPSQTMLNEFRMTLQRADILQAQPATNLGTPASFGSKVTPDNPTGPPLITFPSLAAGFSPQGPSVLTDNTFTYADTFSWIHGKHTMKLGGSFSAFQNNQVFDFFVDGDFDFIPSLDGVNPFGAGDALANFLVGIPDGFFQSSAAHSNIRSKSTSLFGQDEWHVANNLVLTYGLRYEYSTPKSDTQGRTFSVVPGVQSTVFPNAPLGLLFPGDKGAPHGINFPRKTDFAPRLGFAWQPFHEARTSVRGGFGVFYDVLKAEDNLQFNGQVPFASSAFILFDPTVNPAVTAPFGFLTDPFGSTGSVNPFPSKPVDHSIDFLNTFGPFGGIGVFAVDPHLRTPYTYQYNINIEHELARKMTVQIAYVGSSSHGLTGLKDINPIDPKTLDPANNNANAQRVLNEAAGPFSFGFLPEFMNLANANYNALQLSLKQQSAQVPALGEIYYTFSYTYAHTIDDISGFRNNDMQVPFFQPHILRGSSDFDLRHALVLSGGWNLPFRRGPERLMKGWSLYPIVSWRTGFPITLSDGLNSISFGPDAPGPSGAGDASLINPNQIAPVQYTNAHSSQSLGGSGGFFFFDPTSFSATVANGYGTAKRDLVRGPGRTNADLSLVKVTPIYGDRVSLRLNVDAFNIFNHTEFLNIGNNVRSNTFGQITSTYSPRILQLGAHFEF